MAAMRGGWWFLIFVLTVSSGGRGQKTEPHWEKEHDLFRGSDQYDFAIVVPGSGLECFWHFAHQSGNFFLVYMVQWVTGMAISQQLYVTVIGPDGSFVASSEEHIGQIHFQTEVTGFYQMCLGNLNNHFGGMRVYLNFGVHYEEAMRRAEEEQIVLNSTLTNIEVSTMKLEGHIFHMWRHYNYARMRRGADLYLLLSNLSYVTWWSAAQSALIVTAGCLQLCFIKRLFRADRRRPTC